MAGYRWAGSAVAVLTLLFMACCTYSASVCAAVSDSESDRIIDARKWLATSAGFPFIVPCEAHDDIVLEMAIQRNLSAMLESYCTDIASVEEQALIAVDRVLILCAMERQKAGVEITEADIQAEYEERVRRGEFLVPSKASIRYISVPTVGMSDEESIHRAREQIEKAHAEIQEGSPFHKVAQKYSLVAPERRGISVVVTPSELFPDVSQVVNSLQAGEVSEVIEGRHGYLLLNLEERIPESVLPFEAVYDAVRQDLTDRRHSEHIDRWIRQLSGRTVAKIDYAALWSSRPDEIVMQSPTRKLTVRCVLAMHPEFSEASSLPREQLAELQQSDMRYLDILDWAGETGLMADDGIRARCDVAQINVRSRAVLQCAIAVSEDDLRSEYDVYIREAQNEMEYLLSQIWLPLHSGGTDQALPHVVAADLARKKAMEVRDQIAMGSSFEAVRHTYSIAPEKNDERLTRYLLPVEFTYFDQESAKGLSVGEVGLPFAARQFIVISKMEDARRREHPPFEQASEKVIEVLNGRVWRAKTDAMLEHLRSQIGGDEAPRSEEQQR